MSREYSENEDDPPVYESSGSEWNSSEAETRPSNRRTSSRTRKKTKKTKIETDSSTDSSDFDDPHPRKKNGVNKKLKTDTDTQTPKKFITKTINSKDFSTGSFLILKKDAQVGDPNKHPCIWRVDGKALLQKYEPFEDEGKVRHRTTSVYTGWSALDRDLYAPITVTVRYQQNHTMIVDLNWEKLKEINMDSD